MSESAHKTGKNPSLSPYCVFKGPPIPLFLRAKVSKAKRRQLLIMPKLLARKGSWLLCSGKLWAKNNFPNRKALINVRETREDVYKQGEEGIHT